jgi:hypothetical protein
MMTLQQAFWSVPDVKATWPGITTPVCVSVVAGFITYLIVFNLNILLSVGHSVISVPQNHLLRKMAETTANQGGGEGSAKSNQFRDAKSRRHATSGNRDAW